ncbi:MAG: type II toxin-antitoxin system prevent-host-death family antitoxin [Pseudomonadota bacterium]
MKQFNFTEARNNFATVLEIARQEGIVCISKRD